MKNAGIIAGSAVLLVLIAALAIGWPARSLRAQADTKTVKKDFINPTRGQFSGAVVVHGSELKMIYVSGHTRQTIARRTKKPSGRHFPRMTCRQARWSGFSR